MAQWLEQWLGQLPVWTGWAGLVLLCLGFILGLCFQRKALMHASAHTVIKGHSNHVSNHFSQQHVPASARDEGRALASSSNVLTRLGLVLSLLELLKGWLF